MSNALIISYLFLGGVGSATFLILALSSCATPRDLNSDRLSRLSISDAPYRRLFGFGYVGSLLIQILGMLCLMFDLGRPDRIFLFVTDPHFSVVSVGAYALGLLVLCTLYVSLWWLGILKARLVMTRILSVIGACAALVVMVYTALLLSSFQTQGFWHSPLILVLFVISSLSTGIAFLYLDSQFSRAIVDFKGFFTHLIGLDVVLIILEILALAAFLISGYRDPATMPMVDALVFGDLSDVFWLGLVIIGLVVPLIGNAVLLRGRRLIPPTVLALLVLVGGVCLRVCIVAAVY